MAVGTLLVALYWAGLQGGFFFDDGPSILYADGVRLDRLDGTAMHEALSSGRSGPTGRPIAQLSFALNHYFSGFDPFVFKAVNLAIHALNGLLVYFLVLHLIVAARGRGNGVRPVMLGAVLLAVVWLIHPIQLTTVLHAVQRMTSLSALFLLMGILLHIRGRERGGPFGAALIVGAWVMLWPLAVLSKESGALFPVFVLTWELILRRRQTGRLDAFARVLAVLGGLTFIVAVAYLMSPAAGWFRASYALRDFSPLERLLTEGRVLWLYLGLILFPRLEAFGLYHDDLALSTGLLEPWTTLVAWTGLVGLAGLAWQLRTKAPLAAFGIAWFFAGHALESTLLPLEIAHEHRNYLPLLGILLAVVAGLTRLIEIKGPPRTLGLALAGAFLLYPPLVTALRAHQFGDELRRTQIEAQHHRRSPRAQYEAGRFLAALPEAADPSAPVYSFARAHFERTSELDAGFKLGWLGLLHLNCKAGLAIDQAWLAALGKGLRFAPFGPADSNLLLSVKEQSIAGTLCLDRGEVELLFVLALGNTTMLPHVRAELHAWLADFFVLKERDLVAAKIELDRARILNPYNPSIRLRQAQLALMNGRKAAADAILKDLDRLDLGKSDKAMRSKLKKCMDELNAGNACSIE